MAVPELDYFLSKAIGNETNPVSAMRYHYMRLSSYKSWPNSACSFPSRLASAGFYYEGKGSEVVCFSCDGKVADWIWEDIPIEKHRRRFPSCLFVNGQDETNVPFDLPIDPGGNMTDRLSSVSDGVKNILLNNQSSVESIGTPRNQEQNDSSEVERSNSETTVDAITSALMTNNVSSSTSANVSSSNPSSIFPESLTPRVHHHNTSTIQPQSRGHSYYANLMTDRFSNSQTPFDNQTPLVTSHRNNSTHLITNGSILNSSTLRALNNVYRNNNYDEYAVSNAQAQYRNETRRLTSFRNWPEENPMNPEDLAEAGFMYTRSGDRVQCVFCFGILRNWEEGDNARVEHRRYFPDCPFVQGMDVSNIPASPSQRQQSRRNQTRNRASALGIKTTSVESTDVAGNLTDADFGIITDRPKHPDYAIEVTRLQSYQRWPTQMKQTPDLLSKAGFFYSGMADNVKCFFCDGGLRNWEPEDDPWVEHARWFSKCGYVKLQKGEKYIKEVAQNYPTNVNTAGNGSGQFDRREIKARMDTPIVMAVMGMGYTKELVTKAITRKYLDTGDDFQNAESLLEAIFDIEEQLKNGTYVEPEIPTSLHDKPAIQTKTNQPNNGLHGGVAAERTDSVERPSTPGKSQKTKKKKVPTATLR